MYFWKINNGSIWDLKFLLSELINFTWIAMIPLNSCYLLSNFTSQLGFHCSSASMLYFQYILASPMKLLLLLNSISLNNSIFKISSIFSTIFYIIGILNATFHLFLSINNNTFDISLLSVNPLIVILITTYFNLS